jgi:hypothetical protein
MQANSACAVPADANESTVMIVWPSVARYPIGRFLGDWFANRTGVFVLTLGNLIALAAIPVGLVLYFLRAAQGICYKLTNRRIMDMRFGDVRKSISLDGFDDIRIEQSSGQIWYQAGDLVFCLGEREVFRLESVCHPGAFRQTCLKTYLSHKTIKQVLDRQAAVA